MIDPEKVKRFWDGRAAVLGKVAFESVANLEQDSANLKLKIDDELAKADSFEAQYNYKRISVPLASGNEAWVYVHAD